MEKPTQSPEQRVKESKKSGRCQLCGLERCTVIRALLPSPEDLGLVSSFPHPSSQVSVTPLPGDLMPSSGCHHQAGTG